MRVRTDIGGSWVVIDLNNFGHYVDARKDVRHPDCSFIERVAGGRVIERYREHNSQAAETIMKMIRRLK